jgi:hypothetical protein
MSALGYTIAGVLIGLAVILAAGVVGALWFAVSAMRPELLERTSRRPRG